MTTQLDPSEIPDQQQARAELGDKLRRLAQEAAQRGELLTAMLHASDALMLFPNERPYLGLVDDIAQATPDPLSLVPVASGAVHPATAAVRARILMTQRKLDQAVALLCRVVDAAPSLAYFGWLERWLQPQVIPALGWELLSHSFVRSALRLGVRVPPRPNAKDPRVANVRSAAACFALLRQHFPNESVLYAGEAILRRRLGDPAATLAVAREAAQRFPQDWRCQIAALNAYGDARQADAALHHARAALALDAQDNSPLHDAGWAYVDAGNPAQGAALFQELLTRDAEYPGAKASFYYARYLAQRNEDDKRQLFMLRERQWWDEQASELAAKLEPVVPYVNYLPGPGDASAAAARSVARELAHVIRCCGLNVEVAFSVSSQYLESPSVGLAFNLAMRALGARGTLEVAVENIQTPDPRAEKSQVAFRLFSYQDRTPQRLYANADPRAQGAVAQVAAQVYDLAGWDAAARQIAGQMGPDWLHALLAVLTDPPLPPENSGFDALYWMYRCQVATALIVSNLGDWANGVGRAAVYSLIYGPTDWLTDAGLIALTARARASAQVRAEIEPVFNWLRSQIPQRGYTCWEGPLLELWASLDGVHPETQRALQQALEDYELALPRKNRVQPPERRYGGLTLEQYAEFSMERDRILGAAGIRGAGAVLGNLRQPPPELGALLQKFGLSRPNPSTGLPYPYVPEWDEAMNANPELMQAFIDIKEDLSFAKLGVSREEKAALDEIRTGNMDMHLRMAQQQAAQREVATGGGGDPDPVVFPGQRVAKLSDYVAIMKRMQKGDMMGALAAYGLDMMSYGSVATAWGAKMAADPTLTEKFSRMMAS